MTLVGVWGAPITHRWAPLDQAEAVADEFMEALRTKSLSTAEHSERVAQYAAALGQAIGLSERRVNRLERAGLLHDIGKLEIDEAILEKPGALTEDEWVHMQAHPALGADLLKPYRTLHEYLPAVAYHHERFDGSGYPRGLRGRDIPLDARIMAIADCYDAMTSQRPYKQALSPAEAASRLQAGSGSHFDPMLVAVFISRIIPTLQGGVLLAS